MSLNTIFMIITIVLVIILAITGFFAFFDWRAWVIRKVGPNKKKGLAHILEDGVWKYRESWLIFEGDDAMSYARQVKYDGFTVDVVDIVPNAIGFDYDEYTGERLYRVRPGGCIGYSDRGEAPAVDYPAELISTHVLDRTVSNYAASVNADDEFNWKPIIVGGIVLIVAALVVLFATGIIPSPLNPGAATPGPEVTTSNQTSVNQTINESQGYPIVVKGGK